MVSNSQKGSFLCTIYSSQQSLTDYSTPYRIDCGESNTGFYSALLNVALSCFIDIERKRNVQQRGMSLYVIPNEIFTIIHRNIQDIFFFNSQKDS